MNPQIQCHEIVCCNYFFSVFFLFSCQHSISDPDSPDGRITVKIGNQAGEPFSYPVFKEGEELVGISALSLEWEIRVFNDGMAFRYLFPENSGFGNFLLTEERSSFNLDPSVKVWATNQEHYYSSQEHLFDEQTVEEIGIEALIGCPILAEVDPDSWLILTEARLTDWAGLYFQKGKEGEASLVSTLASLKRDPSIKLEVNLSAESPWRVIMVGDGPGDLIEFNMIVNLNDPVEYSDVDWIRPGVSAWDRCWSGDYAPAADFQVGINTSTMKYSGHPPIFPHKLSVCQTGSDPQMCSDFVNSDI